jgi:ATP-grasp domain-containing protein
MAAPDLEAVAPLVAGLACPFVTTDLAQLDSPPGGWRVVEVGDGQVSDLPTGIDPTPLFERLAAVNLALDDSEGGPTAE